MLLLSNDGPYSEITGCQGPAPEQAGLRPGRGTGAWCRLRTHRHGQRPGQDAIPAPAHALDILLVEDSAANSMLIELYLKGSGHRLSIADNGRDALKRFTEKRFDLVLMDIEMPVMDGFECTERLRKWERDNRRDPVPIVALTAHALSEVRGRVLASGCDSFLTKPITRSTLLKAVNGFTARRPQA